MIHRRGRLYPLLLLLIACGYVWLLVSNDSSRGFGWDGCLTRYFFHIPCPSCGTTRAVYAVFHGKWIESLYYNPLGILLAAMMVVVPVWIIVDVLTGSATLLKAYCFIERKFQTWPYALAGILAILINWIWNLVKYM
ncbi:MAG: DUF2752 domain-containing protein [Bacteroidaceae bacterium]|nr:DUF2752 domain-containing protein [Bacteroidaceae bacterium]